MKKLSLVLVSLATILGCATHSTKDLVVAKSEGKGMSEAFVGRCSQHWPNVLATANHLGLETLEEHAPNQLLTSYQKRGEAGGNFVGVFLEEKNERCEIRVVSMRRDDAVPSDNDWDTRFFAQYHAK